MTASNALILGPISDSGGTCWALAITGGGIYYGSNETGQLWGSRLRVYSADDTQGTNLAFVGYVGVGSYVEIYTGSPGGHFGSQAAAAAAGIASAPLAFGVSGQTYIYVTTDDIFGGYCGDNGGQETVRLQAGAACPTSTPTVMPTATSVPPTPTPLPSGEPTLAPTDVPTAGSTDTPVPGSTETPGQPPTPTAVPTTDNLVACLRCEVVLGAETYAIWKGRSQCTNIFAACTIGCLLSGPAAPGCELVCDGVDSLCIGSNLVQQEMAVVEALDCRNRNGC